MIEDQSFRIATNAYGAYCVPLSSAYTHTSRTILAGRVHEPGTIRFIIENSRGKDIVHAGAGFGDFLPALSRHCGGRVFAFEPNHENYRCARKTVEINGLENVHLFNAGLGEIRTEKYVRTHENGLSLGPRTETIDAPAPQDGLQPCEIWPLDDVIPQPDVSIIHLDTEGYEFSILKGARHIIETCRPIIVLEIDGRALDYNEFMRSIGYAPRRQLIYNARQMVFVNTVYRYSRQLTRAI